MKRVIVTGASGFIGQPSVLALRDRGFEVHAISSKYANQHQNGVTWHELNLHNKGEVAAIMAQIKPAYLLHLAWYVEHGKYWSSPENLKWVITSLELAEQFLKHGGRRLVCAGTCAEYDWRGGLCSERSTPINPQTLYGASKTGLQTILNSWAKNTGVSFAWGRIFFPYGPHENSDRLIPSTVLYLLRNEIARCNRPDLGRDFIYVEDVAEIFATLVDSDYTGPINIGSGNPVKLGHAVDLIAKMLNASDLVEHGLNSEESSSEPLLFYADTSELQNVLKRPAKISLEEGLNRTISWWRSRLSLTQASSAEPIRKSG